MEKLMESRQVGLVKEKDTEVQLEYSFFHSNTLPSLTKALFFLLTLATDLSYTRHLHLYWRLIQWTLYMIVNHFIVVSKKETIRITRGIGMEFIVTTGAIIPSAVHKFLPSNKIVDVCILEGFKGLQVVYYLACIVENDPKLSLILQDSGLRINDLKTIRHDIRQMLF